MNTNSNLEFRKIESLKFLYEINENGTIIRNVKSKKQLKIYLDKHHSKEGYYRVMIHIGGRKNPQVTSPYIHNLVAECWLGKKPEKHQVDHIDRNPHNNDYRNLRYVTISEQMKNRDHSKISIQGSKNLELARQLRAKKVVLIDKEKNEIQFDSYADASRFLAEKYDKTFESMRYKIKANRSHIFDYDVKYPS